MFRRPQGLQSLIRALPNSSTFLRRFQSTQSGSSQINLKADIRALYRKVHPDLFHEYPDERRTNETSLKHLQNYLSQVGLGIGGRGGGGDGGGGGGGAVDSETRPGALKLQFYVRDAGAVDPSLEIDKGLRLVTVSLPPPMSQASVRQHSSSSRSESEKGPHISVTRALHRLLRAVGVTTLSDSDRSSDPSSQTYGGEGGGQEIPKKKNTQWHWWAEELVQELDGSTLPLRQFAQDAAEVLRRQESSMLAAHAQVSSLRAAFRMARGLTVTYTDAFVCDYSPAEQVAKFVNLARALDIFGFKASPDPSSSSSSSLGGGNTLEGCRICLGHPSSSGIDSFGTIWLNLTEDWDRWAEFLVRDLDMTKVRNQMQRVSQVRQMENRCASALGVGLVYTTHADTLSSAYWHQLNTILNDEEEEEEEARHPTPPLLHVPLSFAPSDQIDRDPRDGGGGGSSSSSSGSSSSDSDSDSGGSCSTSQGAPCLDEELGLLRVPIGTNARIVRQLVREKGPLAEIIVQKSRAEQEEAKALTDETRRRLGLRRLAQDPTLSYDLYRRGCDRLLQHEKVLLPFLEGLSLRIGPESRAPRPDSPYIDIAWDIEM